MTFIERRPAARLLDGRRSPPAGRSRRRLGRSGPGDRRIRRLPRKRGRARARSLVPSRPRKFEQKLRVDEGITLPVERLLAIAERELRDDAGGVPRRRPPNGGDAIEMWRQVKQESTRSRAADRHGARAGRRAKKFLARNTVVSMPETPASASRRHRNSCAGRSPACGRRARSRRSRRAPSYYLTDVEQGWPRSGSGAPARLRHADAVEHLDARGVSRATSSTTSTCGRWSRRCAARRCSRRRRTSKAGRTTASR